MLLQTRCGDVNRVTELDDRKLKKVIANKGKITTRVYGSDYNIALQLNNQPRKCQRRQRIHICGMNVSDSVM